MPAAGTPELYRKLGDTRAQGLLDAVSVFALVWSACCTTETAAGRQAVATFLRALLDGDLAAYMWVRMGDVSGTGRRAITTG